MTATSQLDILRRIQRILEEGGFAATYKLALLQALADLCVEQASAHDGALRLPLREIAQKVILYYWRQTAPFTAGANAGILRQNTGQQAAIVSAIVEARFASNGSLAVCRDNAALWTRLVRKVATTVKQMPLWKLQSVGREADEFLYRKADFANDSIVLRSGVADTLRSFHGLITHLIRGHWVDQIRRIDANRDLLGASNDLQAFLFGTERQNLDGYRRVLREYQSARCFYCEREVRDEGAADHFVAWTRYPLDLGHNFVFAHTGCNASKSDYLAHSDHLAHWREQNLQHGGDLGCALTGAGLIHDLRRSEFIARWAYEQGETSGAHAWLRADEIYPLDGSWRHVFSPLLAVAEPHPPYDART